MEYQIATHWIAAARAGLVKTSDWQGWADGVLLSMAKPPRWVIDMSMATDLSQLNQALADQLARERNESRLGLDGELEIAYLWLRHQRHQLGPRECLRLMGDRADSSNTGIDCEVFYEMLNRLERGESAVTIESELNSQLGSSAAIEDQWEKIIELTAV